MLDESEVKRIIQMTIKELKKQELLRDAESAAYKEISERLYRYYDGEQDEDLRAVLMELECERYFDVILLFYCERHTVESIAEQLSVDVRTVSRNKKRLCLEIYMRLPL
jgi:DNA-directed RNA polymerase specialized sigma24 family protein